LSGPTAEPTRVKRSFGWKKRSKRLGHEHEVRG
jgi:hypothetical protein